MIKHAAFLFAGVLALAFAGCLATPVADSHSIASVKIQNTNEAAILGAAQEVFADYGYSPGPMDSAGDVSFEKPAKGFSRAMWGGYMDQTVIRVVLIVSAVPGGNDYMVRPRIYAVRDGDVAGFSDKQRLTDLWALEFKPVMAKIQAQAQNAGS